MAAYSGAHNRRTNIRSGVDFLSNYSSWHDIRRPTHDIGEGRLVYIQHSIARTLPPEAC